MQTTGYLFQVKKVYTYIFKTKKLAPYACDLVLFLNCVLTGITLLSAIVSPLHSLPKYVKSLRQ